MFSMEQQPRAICEPFEDTLESMRKEYAQIQDQLAETLPKSDSLFW